MSGVDQPIVIANSGYHVGHERSWRAAEEQGFVKEEGLEPYVYKRGGLIPERWEPEVLGELMWEQGIDIATAVDVRAAVVQRARGEDVYIVGGWRIQSAPKLIGAKGINGPEQLRGARVLVRSKNGLRYQAFATAGKQFGIDPERDIEWIETRDSGESSTAELLRSGEVTVVAANSGEANRLISEGFTLVFDLEEHYKRVGAWPPGKVIVATERTIEQRGQELRAFLRASLRGFWFVQDLRNHRYMYDLETRLRQATFNDEERSRIRILKTDTPPTEDPNEVGVLVMDGLVTRPGLAGVIEGMVRSGALEHSVDVDDVLKDAASIDACEQLLDRGLIDRGVVEQWRSIRG